MDKELRSVTSSSFVAAHFSLLLYWRVLDFEVRNSTYFCYTIALDRYINIHLLLLLLFFSEGTPESVPHSLLTPPPAVSPGAHPHIPLTLPRVPAHVLLGQHILSASKFNKEQVYLFIINNAIQEFSFA